MFGDDPRLVIEIGEIGQVLVRHQHNVAALAAIPAIRPAAIDIFLAPKRNAPVPPVPALTRILTLSTNMGEA